MDLLFVNNLWSFSFQYKYQINIDGTVAAYRLPYLLAGNSVVLKQDSIYYEHFYNELQPWKHYIPFKSDLSDLLEKLQWAKEHDEEVNIHLEVLSNVSRQNRESKKCISLKQKKKNLLEGFKSYCHQVYK